MKNHFNCKFNKNAIKTKIYQIKF